MYARSSTNIQPSAMEVLTFSLGREDYALNIQQVQEIRSFEPVTRVAQSPEYVKGLINLRGVIVPIVDLRVKLGIGEATFDGSTAVVITSAQNKTVGFVVDRVNDVQALTADQLKPLPDIDVRSSGHITGLGVTAAGTLILVDAEMLLPQ